MVLTTDKYLFLAEPYMDGKVCYTIAKYDENDHLIGKVQFSFDNENLYNKITEIENDNLKLEEVFDFLYDIYDGK